MADIDKEFSFDKSEARVKVRNTEKFLTDGMKKNFPRSSQISVPHEYEVPERFEFNLQNVNSF